MLAGRVSWRAPQWIWPDIDASTGISYQDMSRYRPLIEAGYWAGDSDGYWLWRLETRTPEQVEWDAVQAEADAAGWEPAFPGAARTLFNCVPFGRGAGCESSDPTWVAHLGLDLPPTILPHDRHPYAGFDDWLQDYRDDQIGFHPPLQPGVNVTYAVKADLNDPSLRPECPQLIKVESLETAWRWARGFPSMLDDGSYEGYLKRVRRDEGTWGRPPVELNSGWGTIWSEADGTWRWRQTVNTPYGWYTFDIDTMQRRPVDTSPGSWDSSNLWLPSGAGGAIDSLSVGHTSWGGYGYLVGALSVYPPPGGGDSRRPITRGGGRTSASIPGRLSIPGGRCCSRDRSRRDRFHTALPATGGGRRVRERATCA